MTVWRWLMNIWEKWQSDKKHREDRASNNFKHIEREPESLITVSRKWYTDTTTIGPCEFDGEYICDILEDTIRDPNKDGILQKEEKVYGKTAIPAGRYEVVMTDSPKFGRVPMLLNVPHYSLIYIHWGNWAKDTLGCLLTGTFDDSNPDMVTGSKVAYKKLAKKIEHALLTKKVFIEIMGGPTA